MNVTIILIRSYKALLNFIVAQKLYYQQRASLTFIDLAGFNRAVACTQNDLLTAGAVSGSYMLGIAMEVNQTLM